MSGCHDPTTCEKCGLTVSDVLNKLMLLEEKIDEIENSLIKRVGILGDCLHKLSEENNKLRKKPHKCPVCDGKRFIFYNDFLEVWPIGGLKIEGHKNCSICDAKGIVWG